MSSSSHGFQVDKSAFPERANCLELLLAFLRLTRKTKHCWGPTEQELREASKLSEGEFNEALWYLLTNDKCIQHRFSKEGTAGPLAHRYEINKTLTISVSWDEEGKK